MHMKQSSLTIATTTIIINLEYRPIVKLPYFKYTK